MEDLISKENFSDEIVEAFLQLQAKIESRLLAGVVVLPDEDFFPLFEAGIKSGEDFQQLLENFVVNENHGWNFEEYLKNQFGVEIDIQKIVEKFEQFLERQLRKESRRMF